MSPFPWTRKTTLALVFAVLGALLTLPFRVHAYFDATNDAAVYILTAQALLGGNGYTYLGAPFTLRPPGFPVVLAPILGTAGLDFRALNLTVSLFGLLSVALFFVWLQARLGTAVALALSAALWLNPGFERLSTQVMSDVPGAALMILCLLAERRARHNPSSAADVLLGLSIALAAYFRTVFVLFLPAVLLFRWLAWRGERGAKPTLARFALRRLAIPAGVTLLLLLPWSVRNAVVVTGAPAEHTWNYSYWVSLLHEDRGDPASPAVSLSELRRTVKRRVGEILTGLGGRMLSDEPSLPRTVLGIAICLCWLAAFWRRREPAEIFTALLFIVMAFYYSNRPRLVLPLYLLVVPAAAELAIAGLRRAASARTAHGIAAGLILLVAVLDMAPSADREEIARGHRRLADLAAHIAESFPPGAPLAAESGAIYAVHMGRPVYSFGPVCRRLGLEGFIGYIRRHGVRGLILSPASDEPCGLETYLADHAVIDDSFGPLLIARLHDLPGPRVGTGEAR